MSGGGPRRGAAPDAPDLYVRELLARFFAIEPDREADLRAWAEHVEGGQLEDAVIALLARDPDVALAELLRWRDAQLRAGVTIATAQRRLSSVRRLASLAEREFTSPEAIAAAQEGFGGTLGQLLARALDGGAS